MKFFGACSVLDSSQICKFFVIVSLVLLFFTCRQNFIAIKQRKPCLRTKYGDFQKVLSDPCLNITSFFWYILVSAIALPLTLTPARKTVPRGILKGRPMNILSVATLDIPNVTFRPFRQEFSHIS